MSLDDDLDRCLEALDSVVKEIYVVGLTLRSAKGAIEEDVHDHIVQALDQLDGVLDAARVRVDAMRSTSSLLDKALTALTGAQGLVDRLAESPGGWAASEAGRALHYALITLSEALSHPAP